MANKVFRFALGSAADPRSGLWRVWTHEDEVHLGVRATAAELHMTLYPTGRWRITIGDDVSKWTRPKEFRSGWTRGPDLLIPFSSRPVRIPQPDPLANEPLAWLPPPASGFVARFSLMLATPRAEGSQWRPHDAPGTTGLAVLPLRTAGALHLNRLDEVLNPEEGMHQPPDSGMSSPPATAAGFEVLVSADNTGRPTLRVSPTD